MSSLTGRLSGSSQRTAGPTIGLAAVAVGVGRTVRPHPTQTGPMNFDGRVDLGLGVPPDAGRPWAAGIGRARRTVLSGRGQRATRS